MTSKKPGPNPSFLIWDERGLPWCPANEDIFFDRANGLEESSHVFLKGNELPGRWLSHSGDTPFTIGEIGFGTGLNFFNLLYQTRKISGDAPLPPLLYLALDRFLPDSEDWFHLQRLFPQLETTLTQWMPLIHPSLHPAASELNTSEAKVTLRIIQAEAQQALEQFPSQGVDAWFYDGFAPAKCPDLWQPSLYEAIARKSRQGATLATFTAVGAVRRGLQEVGFSMRKVKGFGKKRDMLVGHWTGKP